MVARLARVARLPGGDHHGSPIAPDVHPVGAQIPPSVKSRHAAAWWRAAQALVELTPMRADARRGLLAVAWQLALISRADATTMPTWSALTAVTGLSRATIARHLRRLRLLGLLTVLETGAGTQAAVYILCQPRRPAGVA